ncbi:hypothetical protein MASR2M12_06340 [Bacteroidales bacterium]
MKLDKNKINFLIFSGIALMYLLSMPARRPHLDDAWIGEHSYWLQRDGVVKSKLMAGVADSEKRLLLHHKLFTLQGAAVIAAVGFSLSWLKVVSLAYLILTVIALAMTVKRMALFSHSLSLTLLLLLLLINPLVFEFGFVFRPEMMLGFLGLLSYFFLWRAYQSNQGKPGANALLSGLFAGLGLATHLNGIIFISAGFLVFMLKRRSILALLFASTAGMASMLYFYDFRSFSDIAVWYKQLTYIPTDSGDLNPFLKLLFNSLREHLRYFHSPVEICLSLTLLYVLGRGWKTLWKKQPVLLLYTFLLTLSLSALALNKTSKYLILLLPYFLMIIALYTDQLLEDSRLKDLKRLGILIIITLFVSLYNDVGVIVNKYDSGLNQRIREIFAGKEAKKMHVLGPMELIFNEIDDYGQITSLMSYNERLKLIPDLKATKLLRTAQNEDIDLILMDDTYIKVFEMAPFPLGVMVAGYVLSYKSDELMVWERCGLQKTFPLPLKLTTVYKAGPFRFHSAFN